MLEGLDQLRATRRKGGKDLGAMQNETTSKGNRKKKARHVEHASALNKLGTLSAVKLAESKRNDALMESMGGSAATGREPVIPGLFTVGICVDAILAICCVGRSWLYGACESGWGEVERGGEGGSAGRAGGGGDRCGHGDGTHGEGGAGREAGGGGGKRRKGGKGKAAGLSKARSRMDKIGARTRGGDFAAAARVEVEELEVQECCLRNCLGTVTETCLRKSSKCRIAACATAWVP